VIDPRRAQMQASEAGTVEDRALRSLDATEME
jgi:hypothetical protein